MVWSMVFHLVSSKRRMKVVLILDNNLNSIYGRRTPLSMGSPAGTITPVSSLCGSDTPTIMSPGADGGFLSPSGDGGFLLSARSTPAVIHDHLRCAIGHY